MSPSDLVLVTGATGFLGTLVVLSFIEEGFRVRGTARSQAKIDEWEARHPEAKASLEWVLVKDIVAPGAFDEAILGVTILAHTASPFHFDVKDNVRDLLEPAILGTREALLAAKKTPTVKRVVVTSSFAAIGNMHRQGPTRYLDDDWNPATFEQAAGSDNPMFVYCASKKLGEEEAWKIAADASFSLTTLCPPFIFGPAGNVMKSLKDMNTAHKLIWAVVDSKELQTNAFPTWVDVRDAARLHVRAATEDVVKGQRYAVCAGNYDDSQIADIIVRNFPAQAHRIPKVPVLPASTRFQLDTTKVERDLGATWINLETSVVDTLKVLFELEKTSEE